MGTYGYFQSNIDSQILRLKFSSTDVEAQVRSRCRAIEQQLEAT